MRHLKVRLREQVKAGSGSFVVAIATYKDYAEAIRRKLVREILAMTTSLAPRYRPPSHIFPPVMLLPEAQNLARLAV